MHFLPQIELNDNDHRKEMIFCDTITDCLMLLEACMENLNLLQRLLHAIKT